MTAKSKNWADQKFGRLTFIEPTSKRRNRKIVWKLLCDCGNVCEIEGTKVATGRIKSCGCLGDMAPLLDMKGKKYWRLTFTGNFRKEKKGFKQEAICDCGNLIWKYPSAITSGNTKSCGCLLAEHHASLSDRNKANPIGRKFEPIISSARAIFHKTYNDSDLTFEDFFRLSQFPCHYCGDAPSNTYNIAHSRQKWGVSQNQIDNGTFIYNGLDRKDSSKGHTLENVVPCCWPCNQAKMGSTEQDFLNRIRMIYEKHFLIKDCDAKQ